MKNRTIWGCVAGAVIAGLCCAIYAAEAEKLEPLPIKLPPPMFQGTPKNIKAAPTLEKYDEKPRPAFLAPAGVTNVALKKKITSSDSAPVIGDLEMITDGDKDGSAFVELAPETQWVQIDLEKPADIYAVLVWHYHAEGRVYHDVVVQVSDDPDFKDKNKITTIFNNDFDNSSKLGKGTNLEYIEDNRGKLIDAKGADGKPVRGRYVRLYSRGNTANDLNHYVEVEVYGKVAK
jgi:hypothetical protein